jgi:hypothetical protein
MVVYAMNVVLDALLLPLWKVFVVLELLIVDLQGNVP